MKSKLQRSWEKNWPEIYCALTNGLPKFVFSPRSGDIGSGVPVFWHHLVNAETFDRDLHYLRQNGYVTINADKLVDHMLERRLAPKKSVVLSIDDGASNLYQTAFPLLKKYELTAVAFIAPGLHREKFVEVRLDSRPCTWGEIQEMHESGFVDFQSHTYEHREVHRWPEPATLTGSDPDLINTLRGKVLAMDEDFLLAKESLEERLGKTIRHLAWPRFNGTQDALNIARKCGYEALWWGGIPRRPDNRPGDSPTHVVRLSGEFLQCLPGEGRISFGTVLNHRYKKNLTRWFQGRSY